MSKTTGEYLITREKNIYEVVIGLEVHAQVLSNSKLFSSSSTKFGAEPNTQVSLVDAAFPGMLPVINEYCIKQAVKTGIGLKAKINNKSVFDRKNYFYADLPQGYQISQYKHPIVGEGTVILDMSYGQREIGIERLHLEQDAGKSIHDLDPQSTFVDLNRSGVALMEIVSKPDLRSLEEVNSYIKKLRSIMRYLGTCDGNMQEGSLRADVNISVRKPGDKLGTRCEIKNLNSIKFIKQAIEYEARRQIKIIEEGGIIEQNTLLFNPQTGKTKPMRSKEEAHDYRYFPDPDLLPLNLEEELIENIKKEIPELPDKRKNRYINDYKLSNYDSSVLTIEKSISDYFDQVLDCHKDLKKSAKLVVNWITSELFAILKKNETEIHNSPITPDNLGLLVKLIISNRISGKIAKGVLEDMYQNKQTPGEIIDSKGLFQVTNVKEIELIIDQILKLNYDKVNDYKAGKTKLLGFFVGQAMQVSKGKVNPKMLNDILIKKLS